MTRNKALRIVETSELLTYNEIMLLKINEQFIDAAFKDSETSIRFLAKTGLIHNERICERCLFEEQKALGLAKRSDVIDIYNWCCKKPCRFSKSLRADSIFEGSKIELKVTFKLIYKYISGISYVDAAFDLGISRQSASYWAELIREYMIYDLNPNETRIGGTNEDGSSVIVEIDESMFFKRKYNRGRITNGTWFIGAIERGTRNAFMIPVANRNAETIINILTMHVRPGTKIID